MMKKKTICFSPAANHYRPQTKLREGYIFTLVCDSVHGGGCLDPDPEGRLGGLAGEGGCLGPEGGWGFDWGGGVQAHTRGGPGPYWGGVQAQAGGCIPTCTEADTPPPQHTTTAAGGTHPTGMHSCLK